MAQRYRDILSLLAVAILAGGLLGACSGDDVGTAQQIADLEAQAEAQAAEFRTQTGQLQRQVQRLEGQLQAVEGAAEQLEAAQVSAEQVLTQQIVLRAQLAEQTSAQVAALGEEAVSPRPSVAVLPEILTYPQSRHRRDGFWLLGSGLEPGQWFRIVVHAGEDRHEIKDFQSGTSDTLRHADANGNFMLGRTIDGRAGRAEPLPPAMQTVGPASIRLYDMDTGTLLATQPWVLCAVDSEEDWCVGAEEVVPVQ